MQQDNILIYKKIKSIADALSKNNATFTRVDLAYELKSLGIKNDSYAVSKLVREAYEYYDSDSNIQKAFLNNDGAISIVDDLAVEYSIEDNTQKTFDIVIQHLEKSVRSLHDLNSIISKFSDGLTTNKNSDVLKYILGTHGVNTIQSQASNYINAYTIFVESYHSAKVDIQRIAQDFVALRTSISMIYREYVLKLIDLYGNSIKAIAPELFDFDSIDFLDIDNMLSDIRLQYEQLSENCTLLMNEIKDNFSNSVNSAVKGYKSAGGGSFGLLTASLTMASHYFDSLTQTQEKEKEFEILKRNIKHDLTLIKGDYARLAVIYRTINDLYIPKANTFYKYSEDVLSIELKSLLDSLYESDEIGGLVEERSRVLAEYKEVESQIADNQMQIDYYTNSIASAESFLSSKTDDYQMAKARKPQKPFFLLNLITLGGARKKYNRDTYDWYQVCSPVIKEYERLMVNIKMDKTELNCHKNNLAINEKQYEELNKKLNLFSLQIRQKLVVDNNIKYKVGQHLEHLVKLLTIAKQIIESKIDEKFVKRVKTNDYRNSELSEKLIQNIHSFTEEIKDEYIIPLTLSDSSNDSIVSSDNTEFADEISVMQAMFSQQEQIVIERGIDLISKWAELQAVKKESNLIDASYNNELAQIQASFNKELDAIDNEKEVLMEIIRSINTSSDHNSLLKGLIALGNNRDIDIEGIISGDKQIEI